MKTVNVYCLLGLTFVAAEQGDSTQIFVQIFKFKYHQSTSDVIFLILKMAWIGIGLLAQMKRSQICVAKERSRYWSVVVTKSRASRV